MTEPTRVAGWGGSGDGALVTWTVAEGRQGRRWREVVALGTATVHALLLETDPGGRFSHLELARADGLWTFHPESDGTLHGNHVRAGADVRHVRGWPFDPDDAVVVEGSPISLAAVVSRHAAGLVAGSFAEVGAIVIGADGELRRLPSIHVERLSATRWRVGDGAPFELDPEGLPILAGGQRRPLEQS